MLPVRIAFYAPLKPPDHAVPSGERLMARQLLACLGHLGHDVRVLSRLRTFSHAAAPRLLAARRLAAGNAVRHVLGGVATAWPPDLWFTYHPYYKAPDLVGPAVARALGIPYVTAEASYAPKRDHDAWAAWQEPVVAALRQAAVNICLTGRDRDAIACLPGRQGVLADLPPFLITQAAPPPAPGTAVPGAPVRLVTVAMMRPGDKLASYQVLAAALRLLQDRPWHLAVVGDGPARDRVRALFAAFPPGRIAWQGELAPDAIGAVLAASDLHVWPGINEAYGMVFLEAAAQGLASVALRTAGVPAVVRHDRTGLLADDGADRTRHFATALDRLLADAVLRARLGAAARAFVRDERSLSQAALLLGGVLDSLAVPAAAP